MHLLSHSTDGKVKHIENVFEDLSSLDKRAQIPGLQAGIFHELT